MGIVATGTGDFFNDSGRHGFIESDDARRHLLPHGGFVDPDFEAGQDREWNIVESEKGPRAQNLNRLETGDDTERPITRGGTRRKWWVITVWLSRFGVGRQLRHGGHRWVFAEPLANLPESDPIGIRFALDREHIRSEFQRNERVVEAGTRAGNP